MTKKHLIITVLVISASIYISSVYNHSKNSKNKSIKIQDNKTNVLSSNISTTNSITYNGSTFTLNIYKVSDLDNLYLYNNLTNSKTSTNLTQINNCKFLINAGFYSTKEEPIGLFITEGETLSIFNTNALLNGIFTINSLATPRISKALPTDDIRLALQTGPILIENTSLQTIKLNNDKKARRMILAITGSNELYFMAIYTRESVFNGPFLTDIPLIIEKLNSELNLSIADAINLDGGSASAFISDSIKLTELSPIGSYFCEK
ncbi:hypothetical protein A2382_04115 [Candidatus Woesebacteria bacterium RIFOXYB1_FULL_38_16]|uniref:Phosphodiester glycosidase domain-containing protein n=1 Tax=Candidatus Woesebacteria bacterium RIFOXYB1_FULL_38_16 TaxID=1802538 RepID=A0A1F8CQY8_9BACT|nr:MAG: hypothetical protein A2191_05110 [Candidatus Woesebacteria bacterium RIFOXYA1_FULL_38_9]OGM78724.1 MAG: hypothetical protein A2382_04115 [Candidatus Woesebacteria bacterium RIFOXYB1_FULL_38_16]